MSEAVEKNILDSFCIRKWALNVREVKANNERCQKESP